MILLNLLFVILTKEIDFGCTATIYELRLDFTFFDPTDLLKRIIVFLIRCTGNGNFPTGKLLSMVYLT